MTGTLLTLGGLRHPFLRSVSASGLSLEVRSGELACIVGASGTGKSTILKLALTVLEPTSGTIALGSGVDQRIGVAFQDADLMPWRRVVDNVRAPLGDEIPVTSQRAMAREALALAALPDSEHLYPDQLSGGMRARVAVARGLVNDPQLLVLDEPFAAVDAALAEDLSDLLIRLVASHELGILMVTQDLDRTLPRADLILVLGHGPLGSNPVIDLNRELGSRSGRLPEKILDLRAKIIETMRNPAGGHFL